MDPSLRSGSHPISADARQLLSAGLRFQLRSRNAGTGAVVEWLYEAVHPRAWAIEIT